MAIDRKSKAFFVTFQQSMDRDASASGSFCWSKALSFSSGCDDVLERYRQDEPQSSECADVAQNAFHMTPSSAPTTPAEVNVEFRYPQQQMFPQQEAEHVQFLPQQSEVPKRKPPSPDSLSTSQSTYSLKRRRNNLAVRKSREKAKRRFEELCRSESRLESENEMLAKKAAQLESTVVRLRDLYAAAVAANNQQVQLTE